MDIRKVKKLIELLKESGISEIQIKEGEESVHIINQPAPSIQSVPITNLPSTLIQQPSPATTAAQTAVEEVTDTPQNDNHIIKSPMVGVFYTAASPDSKPFSEVGQTVKKGDVLCVIEAMKIMNQIEADTDGVISRILVGNGEPVEYGQSLFIFE